MSPSSSGKKRRGRSNSPRSTAVRLPKPWEADLDVGLDTISFAWRTGLSNDLQRACAWAAANREWFAGPGDDTSTAETFPPFLGADDPRSEDDLPSDPASPLPGGGVRVSRDGLSFLFYPRHGLVAVEGRASQILGDPARTVPFSRLSDLAVAASLALGDLTGELWLPDEARVRRLDLAADLRFDEPRIGLGLLEALAVSYLPRFKLAIWRSGPRAETVSFVRAARRRGQARRAIWLRAYDKGVEQGSQPPGRWIRLERQVRYQRDTEMSVSAMAALEPADLFISGLESLAGRETVIGDLGVESWERLVFEAIGRTDIIAPRDGRSFRFQASHAARLVGEGRAVMTFGDEWFSQTGQDRRRLIAQQWLNALGLPWPSLSGKPPQPVAPERTVGSVIDLVLRAFTAQKKCAS